MKINITRDLNLKAGTYKAGADLRYMVSTVEGEEPELTIDFQLAAPPVVIDPPPPVDPPAPPAPPTDPPAKPPASTSTAVAKFSFKVADDGSTVSFTDESTGAVKEQWSWGTGGTSAVMGDQVKQYSKAGDYVVTLLVWDAAGKSSKYSATVTTTEDKPVAAPAPSQPPASTKAGFNCSLLRNVMTVNDVSSGSVSQHWDFGDGTTSDIKGKQPHTYEKTGDFVTRQTCTAADGTSNYYEVRNGSIAPSPVVEPPAVSLAGQPVTVIAPSGATFALHPGDVVPLIPGNQSGGAAIYYPDGKCVRLVNDYAGTTGDVTGHYTVSAGGVKLFDGDLLLPAHAGTRPIWLEQPQIIDKPDLSCMPKLGPGSESASWADAYALGDNGIIGVGNVLLAIGTGGEHPTLGPVPEWDADDLTNPSAANAHVVRCMADALGPIPMSVRDFKTGKMLDVRQYPRASMLSVQLGVGDNPISKFTTIWPFQLGQCQSHATNYGALACELYTTDYDREQAAMWCNYVNCLTQNYTYRSPLGCCVFRSNAARGFGRGLTVLLNAARNAPGEFKPLFQSWVDEAAADGTAAWVGLPGMGIMRQGGALSGNVTAYAGGAYAPWMQDILTAAVGQAIQYGHAKFQPILDAFADYTFDRVLKDHEFATLYNATALRADGTWVDNWAEGLQVKAASDPAFAAALAAPEGSAERAKYTGGNPGDFMGYPTSATGYPAMYQAALAVCVRYATNQTKAQAAWAAFQKWQRIDHSANPKYNLAP